MNKQQYLNELRSHLISLNPQELQEILYDYEEHFENAKSDGKSELEVVNELGAPSKVAEEIMIELPKESQSSVESTTSQNEKRSPNIVRNVLIAIALIFINLIVVVGPVTAIISVYISMYGVAISIGLAPLFGFIQLGLYGVGNFFVLLFSSIFSLSLATLMVLGLIYVGKWIIFAIKKYIHLNIQVVKGEW
ncbi:DUF1700 domain-containing protein [Alkalibacillus haloalkaliphilus]|uniref:DUF1700 domain-containing protein n=1 Tax=Alkalibacillus haloalkaliphilus TaxID=94136 RepID=UPI0002F2B323|nr:DUF1700 domain-containing protein [Alkalibacillus haloalkaliphilus]